MHGDDAIASTVIQHCLKDVGCGAARLELTVGEIRLGGNMGKGALGPKEGDTLAKIQAL